MQWQRLGRLALPSRQALSSDVRLLHGAQGLLGLPFHTGRWSKGRSGRRVPLPGSNAKSNSVRACG